jgi:hypothetical protein
MPAKGGNRSENLIRRTRKLIDGYPKNSILREFLQNADDSKATELVVTFDARIHSFQLSNLDFSPAKGPALLIHNNSEFNEQDFNAIVQIGAEESKQSDADATGRFGEGFNSSFSISDHPSFVSNGRAYWFDILREAVSKDANTPDTPYWIEQDFDEIQDWLKTFSCTNQEQISNGTIFRLPLRTFETKSKISREVFSRIDFLKWVDEWKSNASHLLFLRHIQKLVLREVDTQGNLTVHLEIMTKNKEEIGGVNNEIQNEFKGDFLEVCNNWKDTENELPFFKYHHHFEVSCLNRSSDLKEKNDERWAVVNGLFRGENNCLIEQAIKALEIEPEPRKVWPWAGVAIQLDSYGKAKKTENSKYFTFLPLSLVSKHPIHIHGGFDLNSERSKITNDESGKDLENLTEWNRLLFKEAIGSAWAYLIDFIKESCSHQSYYSLWPKNHEDEFDEYLLEGFYKKINELKVFKTRYKKEENWNTPKGDDIYLFQNTSDTKLLGSFREHFSIISPKPTKNIIDGLSSIGTDLEEITPDFIRDYLNDKSDGLEFPFPLEDIPIAMLSKKEWVLSILIFCAEANEDKDFSLLENLPLELTCDNKLNRIVENKLLDSKPKLSVFKNDKSLFLHPEIIEIVKDAEELPLSWLKPNLKSYLTILGVHIDNYDLKSKNWLKSIINMIAKSDANDISEAIDQIYELKIVYQHNGTFGQLMSDIGSPILMLKEEIHNIDYLAQTNMALVDPEYVDIYRPLLKWNEHELITELNSLSLAKHLLNLPEEEYEFFNDIKTREYLIDLLAQDITWIDVLSQNEKNWLNAMPFIVTENDNIHAKSEDIKLYLPAGFQPPKYIQSLKGEFEIIRVVDDKQHAMYRRMGFEEQNPNNYLKQIIIPFIGSSPLVEDVSKISEWLANNWGILTKDIEGDEEAELINSLSIEEIVLDTDNNLNIAKNYYHPDFYSELPIYLQDKKYSPLQFEDNDTQKNWSDLLTKLGASKKIIPEHIVTTVHSIIADESIVKSKELLNYISNHFECFDEMKYEEKNIFDHLSDFAWILAEKPKKRSLFPEHDYKKLYKPRELILKNDYTIAGGAHHVLSAQIRLGKKDEIGSYTEKFIAEKLGLLVELPNDSVFESFRRLQSISAQHRYSDKNSLDYSKVFYKYLARSHVLEKDIPVDIKQKSIFIKGNWLPSSKVFQKAINLTGIYSWDDLIVNDGRESKLADGLIKLGVLEKPDNEYLINFLNSLPQNKKLEKKQLEDAKAILKQLQSNLEEIEGEYFPLLTRSEKLMSSENLYIKDLKAYDNSNKRNEQLEFCQPNFKEISIQCGVASLADNIIPELDTVRSNESDEADHWWNDYIRSAPLKSAVLRLIYHEGKISEEEINQETIDKVLPSEIRLMDSLVVSYSIDETWIYDDISTATYQDTENSILYILNLDDEEDMCDSIAKFVSDKSGLQIDSFSLINRILRHKLETFEEISNLLDKRNIKSLPDKFEIDEDVSLYDDVTEEVDEEISFNNNYEDEQTSSNEHNSSIEDDTQINHDSSSEEQKGTQTSEDISPPIKPKKSNTSNMKDETSSNGDHNRHGNQGSQKRNGVNNVGTTKPQGTNSNHLNSSTNNKIVSPNNRKPVYVGKEKEIDSDEQREQKELATEIGNKGEDYVLEHSTNYLLSKLNKLEKAPINQKGFDILEINSSGEIVRYIEVKTLTGEWGEGGVSVTESQFEFAQVYDNWWLFVVENMHTQNTRIHTFENPVQEANRFMFDHSWKQLGETTKNNHLVAPKEGDKYKLPDDIYKINSIEPMGKLVKVMLEGIKTGKKMTKKFDHSWEKC